MLALLEEPRKIPCTHTFLIEKTCVQLRPRGILPKLHPPIDADDQGPFLAPTGHRLKHPFLSTLEKPARKALYFQDCRSSLLVRAQLASWHVLCCVLPHDDSGIPDRSSLGWNEPQLHTHDTRITDLAVLHGAPHQFDHRAVGWMRHNQHALCRRT